LIWFFTDHVLHCNDSEGISIYKRIKFIDFKIQQVMRLIPCIF
jgi:hypothetical protein